MYVGVVAIYCRIDKLDDKKIRRNERHPKILDLELDVVIVKALNHFPLGRDEYFWFYMQK